MVAGDELFDAVIFLGAALEMPALLPGHDDWSREVTAEFVVLPRLRSLVEASAGAEESAGALVRCAA